MLAIEKIENNITNGQVVDAHSALDQLLTLGPSNIGALKLKAKLYSIEGRFTEEDKVWSAVSKIDNEDSDAVAYYLAKMRSAKEYLYYTDALEDGGRRYMCFPKKLLISAVSGLFGCFSFLLLANFSTKQQYIAPNNFISVLFVLCVCLPWYFVIKAYLTSLKHVSIDDESIRFKLNFKKLKYEWKDVSETYIACYFDNSAPQLFFVLVPGNKEKDAIVLNITSNDSSLKSIPYFISEVARRFKTPINIAYNEIGFASQKIKFL